MTQEPSPVRDGEYAVRGDYHRSLDPQWNYSPTFLAKLQEVRQFLDDLPPGARVLDAGCGEGVLVEEYSSRLAIEGLDAAYESPRVRRGSVLHLPYESESFDRVLCLDVLEHLLWREQGPALLEIRRVLRRDGEALISVPNLAHLQSRVHFLFTGRLIRTAHESKHPGDRPLAEYERLIRAAGLEIRSRRGLFPTVPVLARLIRRYPARLTWLHQALTTLLPVPGWCFLALLRVRPSARS